MECQHVLSGAVRAHETVHQLPRGDREFGSRHTDLEPGEVATQMTKNKGAGGVINNEGYSSQQREVRVVLCNQETRSN